MTIYEVGKEIAGILLRLDRLERTMADQTRLLRRALLVAIVWIAAVLIAAYSGTAAIVTAQVAAKLLVAALK